MNGRPVAVPVTELVELGPRGRDVGQPEVDAHRLGEHVQHPDVGQRVVPRRTSANGRSRPSQSRNVPAFSTAGATGQHHVGPLGDRGLRAARG